jgi:hypothetical protein
VIRLDPLAQLSDEGAQMMQFLGSRRAADMGVPWAKGFRRPSSAISHPVVTRLADLAGGQLGGQFHDNLFRAHA